MKQRALWLKETLFSGALMGAHQLLRVRGFTWEVHHSGDLKLGLWRKKFRKKDSRRPIPKRFVFVPGFGDTPLSWLGVLTLIEPVLRAQFDEIAIVDFPGYNGLLANESFFPSMEHLFDALFDTLDSLKPHTVVGHSLGGFLTAHYAAACSSGKRLTQKKHGFADLDHAVVIDPSGFYETEADRDEWKIKMDRLVAEGAKFWRPFIFSSEPIWFKLLGDTFLRFLSKEDITQFLLSAKPEHEVRLVLPSIQTRVSLIWGEKDSLLPADLVSGWKKHLSSARGPMHAVIIRDTGHSPQIETPVATAAVLGQILSGLKPHDMGKRWYYAP